jgi:hypothetical protein
VWWPRCVVALTACRSRSNSQLFARSLLAGSAEWPGRFQLLETLKAYAEDRLVDAGEADDTRELLHRHFAPHSTPTLVVPTQSLSDMVAMEPDHANITQITDWLHSAERWNELADFLLHTGLNSTRNPARTLTLLGQCHTHIDDPDVNAELAQCQIFNQMAAADWGPYVATCLEEMGRDDPHYAGWANLTLSMLAAGGDSDQAMALIDRFVELPSQLDDDTKRLWEMNYRATANGLPGQADPARRNATEVVAIGRRLGVDYQAALWNTQILGVCSWADGDHEGLTKSIDDLHKLVGTTNDPVLRIMGDFLIALASIGDTETMGPLRQYLRRCATGQLALGESDALVILAAVAEAEGDIDHARTLITSPIVPRSQGTHLAMHVLAGRLGIGDEVRERRKAEREDGRSRNLDIRNKHCGPNSNAATGSTDNPPSRGARTTHLRLAGTSNPLRLRTHSDAIASARAGRAHTDSFATGLRPLYIYTSDRRNRPITSSRDPGRRACPTAGSEAPIAASSEDTSTRPVIQRYSGGWPTIRTIAGLVRAVFSGWRLRRRWTRCKWVPVK